MLYFTKDKWAKFSPAQKTMINTSCNAQMMEQFAEGEAKQFAAMAELQKKGVTIKTWSPEFLKKFEDTWNEVAKEQAAKSPEFAKAWESYSKFRTGYAVWKDNGYLK